MPGVLNNKGYPHGRPLLRLKKHLVVLLINEREKVSLVTVVQAVCAIGRQCCLGVGRQLGLGEELDGIRADGG